MAEEKNIRVSFVDYDTYESYPTVSIQLGQISTEKMLELQEIFSKSHTTKKDCVYEICAEYSDSTHYEPKRNGRDTRRLRSYELSGMFYTGKIPLCAGCKKPQDTEHALRMCARNLSHGRCKDEFMRRTLGVALFPQYYAKEIQK